MNRELIITNLCASTEAKENAVAQGLIEKPHVNLFKKHLKGLSDDDLLSLAEQNKVATELPAEDNTSDDEQVESTMLPEWLPSQTEVDTFEGGVASIETAEGTLIRVDTLKSVEDGSLYVVYRFKLANGDRVRTINKMMDKMYRDDVFARGDKFTFRSIEQIQFIGKDGRPVSYYQGIVLESGDERFMQHRDKKTKKDLKFATLNKDTQKEIRDKSATKQADDFLTEFGFLD